MRVAPCDSSFLPFGLNGAVAQLGEHRVCNAGVVGSSPSSSTSIARNPEGSWIHRPQEETGLEETGLSGNPFASEKWLKQVARIPLVAGPLLRPVVRHQRLLKW